MRETWQLHEAKSKLSQVVENAINRGPQMITGRGVKVAVVIPYAEFHGTIASRRTLWDI